MHAPNTGSFQIYSVNYDGSDLRQLTTDAEWGTFNAFQLFNVRMIGDLLSSLRIGKDDCRVLDWLV